MPIVKTEAFVLKTFRYGETSKIVTLFTKDFGKMNAIVKGARNFKSKLCGTLESMNYITAVIYLKYNRDLQLISNAEYKKSYSNIIADFDKLEVAYKVIEIMNKSLIEHYSNKLLFEILMKTFTVLNCADKNHFIYVLYFQIQLTKILGLSPDFSDNLSGNETFFNNNEFYISNSMISSLMSVAGTKLENVCNLEIDKFVILQLISCYEKYLASHTQGFKFYKSSKVFQDLNYNL